MKIYTRDKKHAITMLRFAQDICSVEKQAGQKRYGHTRLFLVTRKDYKAQNSLTDFERGFIAGRNSGINAVQRELHKTIMELEERK